MSFLCKYKNSIKLKHLKMFGVKEALTLKTWNVSGNDVIHEIRYAFSLMKINCTVAV